MLLLSTVFIVLTIFLLSSRYFVRCPSSGRFALFVGGFSTALFVVALIVAGVFSAVPVSAATTQAVSVRVKGDTGTENVKLEINGVVVASWDDISTELATYRYVVDKPTKIASLRVLFDNDGLSGGRDKNVRVDYVEIDGSRYETEAPNVFSKGMWTPGNGCREGYKQRDWSLACNGWLDFEAVRGLVLAPDETVPPSGDDVQPSGDEVEPSGDDVQPSGDEVEPSGDDVQPSGDEVEPSGDDEPSAAVSTIAVHARGHVGDEKMVLTINGAIAASWANIGRQMRVHQVEISTPTVIDNIRVEARSGGWPQAIVVDKITIDGTNYESEAVTVRSKGSWNVATQCAVGFKRSEWLSCAGSWFDYAAAVGSELAGGGSTEDGPSDDDGGDSQLGTDETDGDEPDGDETDGDETGVDGAGGQPSPSGGEPSTVDVHARGRQGTEDVALTINGQTYGHWKDLAQTTSVYSTAISTPVLIEQLRVESLSGNWPEAVVVDKVVIDGVTYQSEASSVRSNGSWNASTRCAEGFKRSEWLSCADSWFEYRDAAGIELAQSGNPEPPAEILVMTKTSAFRHDSLSSGIEMLNEFDRTHNYDFTFTDNSALFLDPDAVAGFDAVLFLNTDSVVFDTPEEKRAFREFIESGKGFIGIHGATATHWNTDKWDWYRDMVGQRFVDHPTGPTQAATVRVHDPDHPSTSHLSDEWTVTDEWYNWEAKPVGVNVLLTVDESTYNGGTMGDDHPIAWNHVFGPGAARVWYTNLGHEVALYRDDDYLHHVLGGIEWVVGP